MFVCTGAAVVVDATCLTRMRRSRYLLFDQQASGSHIYLGRYVSFVNFPCMRAGNRGLSIGLHSTHTSFPQYLPNLPCSRLLVAMALGPRTFAMTFYVASLLPLATRCRRRRI
jgi:hypothetical protein